MECLALAFACMRVYVAGIITSVLMVSRAFLCVVVKFIFLRGCDVILASAGVSIAACGWTDAGGCRGLSGAWADPRGLSGLEGTDAWATPVAIAFCRTVLRPCPQYPRIRTSVCLPECLLKRRLLSSL